MVVLPWLLAVCALGADPPQTTTPPPREIIYDVRYGFVEPSWRGSTWFRSLKEIGRQGRTTVWLADAATAELVLRLQIAADRTPAEPPLTIASLANVQTRIEQVRRVPQSIVIQRLSPANAQPGLSATPAGKDAPPLTSHEAGETEIGYRGTVTTQYQPGSVVDLWRIQMRLEESFLNLAVNTVEGTPDPARPMTPVINCLIARPERGKQSLQGEWTVRSLSQNPNAGPGRLIVSFGERPSAKALTSDPFHPKMEEAILILAPRFKSQPALGAPSAAKPASVGSLGMNRRQDRELERVKAEAVAPILEGPKIVGRPIDAPVAAPSAMESAAPIVKSYNIADLVPKGGLTAIARKVFEQVASDSWRTQTRTEGVGTITPLPINHTLIIRQTPQVHREIEEKLRLWRSMRTEGMPLETLFPAAAASR